MTTSPSLDDFLSTARREFGFLVSDFGFAEHPDRRTYRNPFSVHYESPMTAITVDGLSYGFGLQVLLHHVFPPSGAPSTVPLWALLEHRAPDEAQRISGQLLQLALSAALLRAHASDVLRGDFTSFPAAMRVVEHHAAEAAKPKKRKLP